MFHCLTMKPWWTFFCLFFSGIPSMGKDNYCTLIFVRVIDIAVDPVYGATAITFIFVGDLKHMMYPTILVNVITIMVIILKVQSHQVTMGKEGLPINSQFTMVGVICLESSVLMIIITCIFFLSSTEGSNPHNVLIPMQLLVHVYVSLHISYRISIQANETHKYT